MSTPPKPAAKRSAAKKPTKAAALKALGLTQEDLDVLKKLSALRAEVATTPEGASVSDIVATPDIVPTPAPIPPPQNSIPAVAPSSWYVRNLRQVEVGLRLDRQQGGGANSRINLKARGQRGDLVKLKDEDLSDSVLLGNVELGVVEIINGGEAQGVIAGQVTNQQTRVHPAMAMLRNELGQEYKDGQVRVEAEFNSQGVTVAHLDPNQINGKLTDKEVAKGGGFVRADAANNPNPVGNPAIISDGFQRNDSAATADAVARRKDLQGPAAGLGGLTVSVDPVQKS